MSYNALLGKKAYFVFVTILFLFSFFSLARFFTVPTYYFGSLHLSDRQDDVTEENNSESLEIETASHISMTSNVTEHQPIKFDLTNSTTVTPAITSVNQSKNDTASPPIWKETFPPLLEPFHNKSDCDTVIFVTTRPDAASRRQVIRETWGARFLDYPDIAVTFVYGIVSRETFEMAKNESDYFGDVLLLDYHDTYDNLSLKTFLIFDYFYKSYPSSHFLIKTDDDVVLFPDNIINYLATVVSKKAFLCNRKQYSPVSRNKKSPYYVSMEFYAKSYFPDHCHGHAYVGTREAVKSSLDFVSRMQQYFQIEDVLFTGFAAADKQIQLIHSRHWHRFQPGDASDLKHILSQHYVHSSDIRQLWAKYLAVAETAAFAATVSQY